MKLMRMWSILAVATLSTTLVAQSSLSPEAQLKAAINREVVAGDTSGAIQQYKDIAAKYSSNHAVASKALLQLAGLYEKQGNAEARPIYQRIVSQYGDTGTTAAAARERLTVLQRSEAGPFVERNLDGMFLGVRSGVVGTLDGKFAAYVKSIPGRTQAGTQSPTRGIYLVDLRSGKERLIVDPGTKPERYTGLLFSPDGIRLAFSAFGFGKGRDYRIVSIPSGAVRSVETELTQESQYRWSPDGKYLAYGARANSKDRYAIRTLNVATGQVRLLGESPNSWSEVLWSPDSRRLAFVGDLSDGRVELRIAMLATADIRTVALPQPANGGHIHLGGTNGWTTKDEIFFWSDIPAVGSDFFLAPAGGGMARKVCEGRVPAGGDGCQGLVLGGEFQIARQNVDYGGRLTLRSTIDGKQTPFTLGSGVEDSVRVFGHTASLDSRLLAFQSNRDGQWGLYVWPADQVPAKSPLLVTPLSSETSIVGGWWTQTGLVVQFNNSQRPVYRIDVDPGTGRATGPIERLTQDTPTNIDALVSPDGRSIAYVAEGPKNGLSVMDARGANEHVVLRRDAGPILAIGWVSDQEVLCMDRRANRNAPQQLFTANVRTGEQKIIPFALTSFASAGYARNTGEFFYVVQSNQLHAYSITKGSDRLLGTLDKKWDDILITSEGRVIYSVADYDVTDRPVPEEIRFLGTDGSPDKVFLKFVDSGEGTVMPMDVSPDGRLLLYMDAEDNLTSFDFETSKSTRITEDPEARYSLGATWSADGRFIVTVSAVNKQSWRAFDGVTYDAVTKLLGGKK